VCAVRGCVEPSDPGLSSTVFPCLFVFAERNKPTRASRAQQPRRRRAPSPWPPSCPPPHSSDPGSLPLAGEPTTRIGQLGWPRARSAIIQGVGSCPTPLPARVAVAAHARLAGAVPCPPLRVACPADPRAWLLLPVRGSQRTPPFVPPSLPCLFSGSPWGGLSLLAGSCVCAVRGCVEPSDPGLSSTVFPCRASYRATGL
jgi:hypothetical protein